MSRSRELPRARPQAEDGGVALMGNASVRISQILVGVVLAFMATILYRTSTDAIAVRTANDTRSLGGRVAQREAVRVDQTLGSILTLKNEFETRGYSTDPFAQAARSVMRSNPMIDVIDYFDENDQHIAHIESGGREAFGPPSRAGANQIPGAVISAVDLVLSESTVTRTTMSSHALRVRDPSTPPGGQGRLFVYVAQPLVRHLDVIGTIIARIDAQRLLADDLAAV
ncbi:MAG TPA: hypothetical protein VEV38_05175, partial [Candidatus Eremiobacteraceae bacterium]|nr:hypothetical protein [Candidatus Eremiobacteraceae bacterium]